MLFEHNIIDNLLILTNDNGHVVICNETQPNVVQDIYAPFGGKYTVLSQKKGCVSISKRGYTLYVAGLSLDEKTSLKSSVEGNNRLGMTSSNTVNNRLHQTIEIWLEYNGNVIDIVPFCYRRDNTEFEPEKKVEIIDLDTKKEMKPKSTQPKRKRK